MNNKKKLIKWSFSAIAIIYLALILFPQTVFANKFDYKNFSVYYHSETIDKNAVQDILDQAEFLLKQSKLYSNTHKQSIFICSSYKEFTFFVLRSRKAFAVNYPLTQNIFLTTSNINSNTIKRNASENNLRSLSAVIAHETTHSYLENKLGTISYKMLPSWKNEGYCDFIAGESSYKTINEKDAVCNDKNASPSFTYFKYRMLTQFLFENKNIAIDEFLTQDFDLDLIEKQYCNN